MRLLAFVALLAVACAAPALTPSASPTPSPAPSWIAMPLPAPGTELAPGRYFKEGFVPSLSLAVGRGWTTEQQLSGFFDIQDDPGSLDVVAVQFTLETGFDTAEDAAADIEGRANMSATARTDAAIGGLSGIRITVDTTDPADSNPVIFRPVLNTPAGPVSIGSGRRLQVDLYSTRDGVLAILVGGSITQWDRAVQLSAPVLESVVLSSD